MSDLQTSIVETPEKKVQKVRDPYKDDQYLKFIQIIKNGEIPAHWELLAETLGVHRNTIMEWKKLPEFSSAIDSGLNEALAKMKETGAKDWKMWRERVAILSREKQKDSGTTINAEKVVAILGNSTQAISHNNFSEENEA